MITVELKNVRFHAFHGLFSEEKQSGNDFDISLAVSWEQSGTIQQLEETVNYARLFELVKEEMKKPRHLLETLLMEIAERVSSEFSLVKEINISITKLNPPMVNFTGSTSVTYRKRF